MVRVQGGGGPAPIDPGEAEAVTGSGSQGGVAGPAKKPASFWDHPIDDALRALDLTTAGSTPEAGTIKKPLPSDYAEVSPDAAKRAAAFKKKFMEQD